MWNPLFLQIMKLKLPGNGILQATPPSSSAPAMFVSPLFVHYDLMTGATLVSKTRDWAAADCAIYVMSS